MHPKGCDACAMHHWELVKLFQNLKSLDLRQPTKAAFEDYQSRFGQLKALTRLREPQAALGLELGQLCSYLRYIPCSFLIERVSVHMALAVHASLHLYLATLRQVQ